MLFDLFNCFESQVIPEEAVLNPEINQIDSHDIIPLADGDEHSSLLDSEFVFDQNDLPEAIEASEAIMPLVDETGNSLLDLEIDNDQNGIPDAIEASGDIVLLVDEDGNSLLSSGIDEDGNGIPDIMEINDSIASNNEDNAFQIDIAGAGIHGNESKVDQNILAVQGDSIITPVFDFFEDVFDNFFNIFSNNSGDIVTSRNFTRDGQFDTKNNVIVIGNVEHDIHFTEQQTHGSCSLMAQEQFVHRYIGKAIPEDYLEWRAEKWGVYSPECGTDVNGQTMILEHFNIPHQRFMGDIDDINKALSEHKDIIIGVDAREFYQDPSIPPGSGHAVAIVGAGIDPDSHNITGYYVTDSNYPDSAHFIDVGRLSNSWYNDMITIPEKEFAVA